MHKSPLGHHGFFVVFHIRMGLLHRCHTGPHQSIPIDHPNPFLCLCPPLTWQAKRCPNRDLLRALHGCYGKHIPNSRFFGGVPTPLMWFSWVWFVFLMRDIIAPLIEQLWDGAYFLKMFSWLVHGCLRDLYVYSFNGHYTPQLTVSPTVPPLKWSMFSGFTTHHFFSSNLPAVFIWGSLFGRHARGYLVFGWRSLDLLYR